MLYAENERGKLNILKFKFVHNCIFCSIQSQMWHHHCISCFDGSSKTSSTKQVFPLIVPAQLKKFAYVSIYWIISIYYLTWMEISDLKNNFWFLYSLFTGLKFNNEHCSIRKLISVDFLLNLSTSSTFKFHIRRFRWGNNLEMYNWYGSVFRHVYVWCTRTSKTLF
jgi:hypothetical protein